ncbi:MAG: hypothetical protein MHPSP_002259, partial [Paramarteilia canceri]
AHFCTLDSLPGVDKKEKQSLSLELDIQGMDGIPEKDLIEREEKFKASLMEKDSNKNSLPNNKFSYYTQELELETDNTINFIDKQSKIKNDSNSNLPPPPPTPDSLESANAQKEHLRLNLLDEYHRLNKNFEEKTSTLDGKKIFLVSKYGKANFLELEAIKMKYYVIKYFRLIEK